MNKTIRIATALTALVAPVALAVPAHADPAPPTVTYSGGCKSWTVTVTAGDADAVFNVYNSKYVTEAVAAGQSATVTGHFKRNKQPHFAFTWANGERLSGHMYWCGAKH